MPRLARKYLESSYCHIIVQGINREYIFRNSEFKNKYKYILKKNLLETKINILAYCIMDNHAHILIHSEEISEITKLMHKTNTSYAKLYNKINKRVGYVFRDRYYTQMITTEKQLWNCIAYIHNNPIKAGIVHKADDYLYSSYKEYKEIKGLIDKKSIESAFGSYKNYIEFFNIIHEKEKINDIIDIKDEVKSTAEIIQQYLKEKNKKLEEIKKDENEFCELLLKLRHEGRISLREMSNIFNINKDKLNKIINTNL